MSKRQIALAVVLYIVATVLFTYPLPFHMGDRIFEQGDSYLTAWIMRWDLHALRHFPGKLFDGNIFFPEGNTLALSELLLPNLVVYGPLLLLSGNPLVS